MSQFTVVENTKTMIRSAVINDVQYAKVQALIAELKKTLSTNDEIRAACLKLFDMKYAFYFIYRNLAVRVKRDNKLFFDLSVLRTKDMKATKQATKRNKHVKVENTERVLIEASSAAVTNAMLDESIEQRLIDAV